MCFGKGISKWIFFPFGFHILEILFAFRILPIPKSPKTIKDNFDILKNVRVQDVEMTE